MFIVPSAKNQTYVTTSFIPCDIAIGKQYLYLNKLFRNKPFNKFLKTIIGKNNPSNTFMIAFIFFTLTFQ